MGSDGNRPQGEVLQADRGGEEAAGSGGEGFRGVGAGRAGDAAIRVGTGCPKWSGYAGARRAAGDKRGRTMGWLQRIRNLGRRDAVGAEIEAEVRAHFDMAVEDGVRAGTTEEEARRSARLRFGNPVVMRERALGADAAVGLEGLWRDLQYAVRQLRRSPGFAATVVLTM